MRYTDSMDKPKVVILSTFLSPLRSGAEACAEEVALALSEKYDITVVTARMQRKLPREDRLQEKVPIIRVGLGWGWDKWLYPFLVPRVVKKLQPRLIHAVLETFAGAALHRCRKKVPLAKRLLTLQTTNRDFLKKKIVLSANKVTAISTALMRIANGYGVQDAVRIPNGIHLKAIQHATEGNTRVFGRILFVGRLEPVKGVDTLLHALTTVRQEFSHASLHIVGDGGERAKLKFLAEKLLIADHVTFTGRKDPPELYQEFAQAEVFCGLSRSEALGNVFLEAQAAGCAVVATNVGGIPDIVKDGETGFLVQPGNAEVAAEAIKKLLHGEELRKQMSETGKKNAANYDWSAIAAKYGEEYEKILRVL